MTKILVVEDEEMLRETITMMLELDGYEVASFETGDEALEFLKKTPNHEIQLLLLDLMLPGLSGLEVIQKMKSDTALLNIPIVLQTGTTDSKDIDNAMKAGAVAYIAKPYTRKMLLTLIQPFLGNKTLSPQHIASKEIV